MSTQQVTLSSQADQARALADSIKADIRRLMAAGTVPATVGSYEELFKHVNAAALGDLQAAFDRMVANPPSTRAYLSALKGFGALCDAAVDTVAAWLRDGGHRVSAQESFGEADAEEIVREWDEQFEGGTR
jgi:hypothetical protein